MILNISISKIVNQFGSGNLVGMWYSFKCHFMGIQSSFIPLILLVHVWNQCLTMWGLSHERMQFVGVGGAFIQDSGTIIGMSYWFNMRDKVRMGGAIKRSGQWVWDLIQCAKICDVADPKSDWPHPVTGHRSGHPSPLWSTNFSWLAGEKSHFSSHFL